MKSSRVLKVKRFVLFMMAAFLCMLVAFVGANFLNHKPYYAGSDLTTSNGQALNHYNNEPNLAQEGVEEDIEYALTRILNQDGDYVMQLVPVDSLVITSGMEVAYADENGDYVFPGDPDDTGASLELETQYTNDPPKISVRSLGNYKYRVIANFYNPNRYDVSSFKVTTTVPPSHSSTVSSTSGDPVLGGTVTSGSRGSAIYDPPFKSTVTTSTTTSKDYVLHAIQGPLTVEDLINMSQEELAYLTEEDLAHLTPQEWQLLEDLGIISSIGSAIGSGISKAGAAIGGTVSKVGGAIGSAIGGSVGSAISSGSAALGGAITNGSAAIGNTISSAASKVDSWVDKTFFGGNGGGGGGNSNNRPPTPKGYYVTTTTTTYTYTYSGGGTTTHSTSPGGAVDVLSFNTPTITQPSYSLKKSTLTVTDGYGNKKQYTSTYGSTQQITKDAIANGSYNTTTVSSRNNQGFTRTGYYISGWTKSGGGSFSGTTFTFDSTNATLTAVWSPLKYAIVWHDKNGNVVTYNGGLNYGASIGKIPTMSPTPGYDGDFYMNGAKVSGLMIVNFSTSIMHAYYQEKARNLAITWDGNGGTFADGEAVTYTITTFNQNYVMPPEVVRPGYDFQGWYTGTNPNSTSARKITSSSKFTNVNEDKMHARWKIRNNLTIKVFADQQVNTFNLAVNDTINGTSKTYSWLQVQGMQNRFTNVYGCTQFVFSGLKFNNGWVFGGFTVKNSSTGLTATDGIDYKVVQNGDSYTIYAYSSIEITMNSCIRAQIKAVSNFTGSYEINDIGGIVSVNGGEYLTETYADVQYGDRVQLSAKALGTKVVFKGYYSKYSASGVNEADRLSPSGQLNWTSNPLTTTSTIYAVFYFQLYTINIYAFSDTKNFVDKQNLTANQYDEIGGKVAVKAYLDDSQYTYSGYKKLQIADGYSYSFGIMVNSATQANTRYRYVGIYYNLSELLSNKSNDDADITSVSQRFTVNGKDVNLYAKFVLEYAFSVLPADEGMDSVTLGTKTGAKGVTDYYYYGESLDRITSKVTDKYYSADTPAWVVINGTLSSAQTKLLSVQTITNGLVMPDMPIEIKARTIRNYFTLTVFAIYSDMNVFEFSAKGGTADITTSDASKVKFESNNGIMMLSYSVTAKVEYKSDAITLVANVGSNYDYGTKYQFVGWYDSFDGLDKLGERLDNPEDGGKYHIESMMGESPATQNGMTFYCAFKKSYYVQVSVDDRVSDVNFENLEKDQESNPSTGVTRYFTYSSYGSSVTFELVKERGEIDKFYQTQGGPDVQLTCDETKTIYNFTMPNYPIYIEITTKGNKFYTLTLRSVLIDDMQALYDDDEGFEIEAGDVRATEVDKVGSTVAIQVEELRSRTLLATPGVGYTFFGWYKLRTDVSFTKIMKDGAASYTENIDTWLNIYNPTTNPNGAYVYFGSDAQVVSDPIERSNKNLYVAVFVKNYTITLTKGDKGIEELGFETISPYDRNLDGENDALNTLINDQGSSITITVPYGSMVDVWSKICENYTFAYYDIVTGKTSLAHYALNDNKILPTELSAVDDYNLSFYLYDNIKLISRTETAFRNALVNIYTFDTEGMAVHSMEGGTFNLAENQGETFEIIIGASLIGFIKVNPGFVFSHFEINGERQEHNVLMPAADDFALTAEPDGDLMEMPQEQPCEINVYFARNAYILSTFIKTIGDDGIMMDSEIGGHVEVDHSIVFGDANTLSLTASMGYVLEGIYTDENCTILAPNYQAQISASETIENYQFYYTYTTNVLDVVPESPKISAYNFYIVYKFLLFDIDKTSERTELNTNTKSEMPDGNFDVFDLTTSLALTKGYYGEKIFISLTENEDLRYYNAFTLTVFDKTNNEEVELFYNLDAQSANIEGEGLGCLNDGITAYFIMPLGQIEIKLSTAFHKMNLNLDAHSNTGTFDNEYVEVPSTGFAELSVFYNFNNYEVKPGTVLKLDQLLSGVPFATKPGFKLVAFNTAKDRSGIDFITYQYDALDTLMGVTLNDFVFETAPENYQEVITLYAIYDYANIEMLVNYTLSGEESYNGSMQSLLQVDIYNYNPEIPYIYTWYNNNNQLIGSYHFKADAFFDAYNQQTTSKEFLITKSNVGNKVVSMLQLRSVNQTGTYTAVVSIDGGALFEEKPLVVQESKHVTIMPLDIGVNITTNGTFYGATVIEVTNANTYGLLPMHKISGTVGMSLPGEYNNSNPPDIDFAIENTILSEEAGYKVTSQDGFTIASNYTVSFEGECVIQSPADMVAVTSGVYYRAIDMSNSLAENFGTTPSTEIQVLSMTYPNFAQAETKAYKGKLTNYVSTLDSNINFGQTITLNFAYDEYYGFYKLFINGEEITGFDLDDTTLSFTLYSDYIVENQIDIRIYVTNDCLVNAYSNGALVSSFRQVYNEEFAGPKGSDLTGPQGYVFEGWYFDEACTQNVPETWQVRGTQNVYANWVLVDISSYIKLVVTDNGVEKQLDQNGTYTKTFDAKTVALGFKFEGITGFTGTANWYKKDAYKRWIPDYNITNLVNVKDGGEYTCEITVKGPDDKTQTISYGKFVVKVVINPFALTLQEGIFDKYYDGKTALAQDVFVDGLVEDESGNKEQLKITGVFAFKDVVISTNQVADIEILNVKILNSDNKENSNYIIANEKVYGKINPKKVALNPQKEKVYNGAIYSDVIEVTLEQPMEIMTYNLETTSKNAGTYTGDGLVMTPLTVSSYLTNYQFSLDEGAYVIIKKADHKFQFENKSVTYDSAFHKLELIADGSIVTASNIDGVKSITYTYDDVVNKEGVTNAGTYLVRAIVESDDNFNTWSDNGGAYLTIMKRGFTAAFTLGDQEVDDKPYGKNYYNEFKAVPTISLTQEETAALSDAEKQNLIDAMMNQLCGYGKTTLNLHITKADVEVSEVVNVGTYKIGITYNDNFIVEGPEYTYFNVLADALSLGKMFVTEPLTYDFNGQPIEEARIINDALLDDQYKTICDFTIQTITKQDQQGMFVSTNKVLKDAGNYQVRILAEVKDALSFTLANGSYEEIVIEVVVKPFRITKDNLISVSVSKEYDGKADFENGTLTVQFNETTIITENISGKFEDQNVNIVDNDGILSVGQKAIIDYTLENASNFIIDDNVASSDKFNGTITPKALSIKLLKNQNYVSALYEDNYTLEINQDNNKDYVSGLVEGETLVATIKCIGTAKNNEFSLAVVNENGYAYLNWQIFLKDGTLGKVENYNLSLEGGIKLYEGNQILAEVVLNGYAEGQAFDNVYTGSAKGIYVKFNGVLAKYVVSGENGENSQFVPVVAGTTLPANITLYESETNPVKFTGQFVDANSYTLTFAIQPPMTDYTKFVGGETLDDTEILVLENEYVIAPQELSASITLDIEYGDELGDQDGYEYAEAVINQTTKIDYKVNLSDIQKDKYLTPRADSYTYTYTQGFGLIVTTADAFADNYTIKATVQIKVETKKFEVSANAYASLPYNMENQRPLYDQNKPILTPIKGTSQANENLYSIKYYLNYIDIKDHETIITKVETNEIRNVGLYSVALSAEYYEFKLLGDENFTNNLDLGNFEITKGELIAEFYGESSVTYNKQYQTPAKVKFWLLGEGEEKQEVTNLLHTITYSDGISNNLAGIQNFGTYTARVAITSDNFEIKITEGLTQYNVAKYVYKITPPQAGEIWDFKYYGNAEKIIKKSFITEFGDELQVQFNREEGEAVGVYKLSNPRFMLEYPNYSLSSVFEDTFGAFHILSYKDVGSQLTISMIKHITMEYDGKYHSVISISDFSEFFKVTDADGIADPNTYDISLEFIISNGPVKDAKDYEIELSNVISSTHKTEDILFEMGSFRFVITEKELTFKVGSLTKVYDGTTKAEFTDVALNGICESDIGTLKVEGIFDNKNAGENKEITVTLIGDNAKNYKFKSQTTTGSITPREVEIQGDLVKEYDGTNVVVNAQNLTITNVCADETINLVGTYDNENVGFEKVITFDLQDDNYSLGEYVYKGAIVVKNLAPAKDAIFSKEYDGNYYATVDITSLDGIVEGDDVEIASAVYLDKSSLTPNKSEGNKFLQITLGGADANNYAISNIDASINPRLITIVYHYGDETDEGAYKVEFKDDQELITNKQDQEQKVRFGYKIEYIYNSINSLAQPQRVGYDFIGWTLDVKNTRFFTNKSNTNLISIEEYNDNGSILDLYAVWEIKTYDVWGVVLTQNANNDDYSETAIGGTYKIKVKEVDESGQINVREVNGKVTLEYFTDITLEVLVNENFVLNSIIRDDQVISIGETYTIKENFVFNIKIDRKILTLKIDIGNFNPSGYDASIWAKQGNLLVSSQKYMTSVKLPSLMVYGYDFMGFATVDAQNVAAGTLINFDVDNRVYTAKFEAKTIEIVINTAGGIGDESFEYADPDRKTILVKFGQKLGNLPLLAKPGYVFESYALYNAAGLIAEVTSESMLQVAENNLTILANWGFDTNKFEIKGLADVASYESFGITNYQTFEMPYEFYYNLGQDTAYTLYKAPFDATTESTVRIKLGKSSINGFKFSYWQVDDNIVKIADQEQEVLTLGSATFAVVEDTNGAYILEIKGFVWGDANPEIVAVFAPETYLVSVNAFNENYGSVAISSGAKLVGDTYLTLAGAVIETSYTENTGYTINLDRTRFEGATAAHDAQAKTFTLTEIKSNVVIDIQFTKNKFAFGISSQGAPEGIAYIRYSINSQSFESYNMKTLLKTEDILQVQIGLKFGYTLSAVVNNPNITLTQNAVNTVNANLTDYFYTISGFVEEFLVILDIGKLSFNVSAEQKIYNSRTDTYADTTLHSVDVKNTDGETVNEMPYLDEVRFIANISPTMLDVNGQVIQNIEYSFLGWFTDKSGEMLLVSTQKDYRFEVSNHTKYYAVFEAIKFSVSFECNDDFGAIVDESNNAVNRSEYVNPGDTLLGTYIAKPLKGYKFVSWTISYTYTDAQNTTIIEKDITSNPLTSFSDIHANIVCSPSFDKRNIAINVKANRIDDATVTDKTQVQIGESFGLDITVNTQTRTEVVVKAIAQNGYAFVNWAFDGVDAQNYNVLKSNVYDEGTKDDVTGQITQITSRVHELYIEFIGDDITTYNLIANFEIATVNIDVSFTTAGVDVVSSGVIETEDGTFKGDITSFTVKTNSSLVLYLNVFKGFLLNDDEELGQFFATDENIVVELEDLSENLSADQLEIFDHRYKVTISNFNANSKVYLFGNTKKVNLHFAQLLDFFENTYEEDVFQGYIRYYTSTIVLIEPEIPDEETEEAPEPIVWPNLTPKFSNCIFLGWSTTQNKNNLVIDSNGVFIPAYWTILEDTHLYPIFEYASVRVDVSVAPQKALVNPYDYLSEVFSATPDYMYTLREDNYMFDIGVSFGLNVPALKEKYSFDKFTYYVVDDNNIIKLVEYKKSDVTINFSSTNLFNIPSMKAFEYSKALNYADFAGLQDSVMYITIACNMELDYKVENYYSDNRENVIGGTIDVTNLSNYYLASFGQEVTIKALPENGYEVKEWWVNNRKLDTNAETITYSVQEPTVFMVKFIGKKVDIQFNLIGAKEAYFAGGNVDDSGIPSIRHVGDIINIFAEANVGFNFTDQWLHSNGQTLTTGQYIVTAEDANAKTITLTPVCIERKVQVYIILPLGLGVVEKDGKQLTNTRNEEEIRFLYSINYTESINVTIKPLQRYKVSLVTLHANGNETEVTENVRGSQLNLTSSLYNNASSLTIYVDIAKTYWMDLIYEQNLVSGEGDNRAFVNDFAGSGKQADPYKITSAQELVQLAYAINEDMLQTNSAFKNAYNRASTYYEIVSGIDLSSRFWSPIGTSQNPFNSNIVIYNMPANIQVDTEDPYYHNSLFNQDVLKQFSGLFGYLGEDATIELKIRDYYMIAVILAVLVIVILIIVFILVITHKIRHESVKNFDQKNEFLFDEE